MKSSVLRSALFIAMVAVSCVTGQNEPVRMNIGPETTTLRFRIVDPIAKRTHESKAKAATGERQLIVTPTAEWQVPQNPAEIKAPAVPPPRIATRLRPAVVQADGHLRMQRKLVPQIRLVQAEDVDDSFLDDLRSVAEEAGSDGEDIDELLDQAQKLIEEEREKAENDRLSPEEIRSRMEEELDDLLPGESDDEDTDLIPDVDDEDGEAEEDDFSNLVDPKPQPIYDRRRQRRQVPYTMGDIFDDDDEVDPVCEQMFCERMWACAGGKCMKPLDRAKRNFRRDYALFYSPCGTPVCRPMENFQCPPRNRQPQRQQQMTVGGPSANCPPMESQSPAEMDMIQELPVESFQEVPYVDGGIVEPAPASAAPVTTPEVDSAIEAAVKGAAGNALTPTPSAADTLLRSIE